MGQSLGFAGTRDSGPGSLAQVRQARNRRSPESPDSDLDFARLYGANVLLVGAEPALTELVCSLWSTFDELIMIRRRGDPLQLPSGPEAVGTLIIHGVETLTVEEQIALQDWLVVRNGRTQVVSTASASLMPMVEAGVFSDSLYYRLNVVCIDLNAR
jgi:Sigma-54 interaction domain